MNRIRTVISRFYKAFWLWFDRDGGELSAAVAYCAAISVLPMFMLSFLLIDTLADDFHWAGNLHSQVLLTIEEESSPQLSAAIEATVAQTRGQHRLGQPLVLLSMLTMSILMFAQIDRGLSRIWDTSHRGGFLGATLNMITNRFRAVLLLLGLAGVMTAMFAVTMLVHAVEGSPFLSLSGHSFLGGVSHAIVHFVANSFFFCLLFKLFSRKTVVTRDALQGACLLAFTWELGRLVMGSLLVRNYSNLYGVTGSFLVILLWIYYASIMLFYSASFVRILGDERRAEMAES